MLLATAAAAADPLFKINSWKVISSKLLPPFTSPTPLPPPTTDMPELFDEETRLEGVLGNDDDVDEDEDEVDEQPFPADAAVVFEREICLGAFEIVLRLRSYEEVDDKEEVELGGETD